MKRPKTGKPVNIRDYKDKASLIKAKEYYEAHYGECLYKVPDALVFGPNYLKVPIRHPRSRRCRWWRASGSSKSPTSDATCSGRLYLRQAC